MVKAQCWLDKELGDKFEEARKQKGYSRYKMTRAAVRKYLESDFKEGINIDGLSKQNLKNLREIMLDLDAKKVDFYP